MAIAWHDECNTWPPVSVESAMSFNDLSGPARPAVLTRLGRLVWLFLLLCLWPSDAHASFLSPELEDKLANILALVVLFVVPVVLIVLFWLVHILPEQIAHKRNHPQFEAIRTLCLLSLVFGGLLWPIAWVWAYSKPVLHKMAYGTDTGDHHEPAKAAVGEPALATSGLSTRLALLEGRVPAADLAGIRADLDAIESRYKTGGGH
jgi:hypothetical protein